MIYPNNFEPKIGFDEIRRLLKQSCLCTLGTGRVDRMAFESRPEVLHEWHEQVREFMSILATEDDFPDEHFHDVRPALQRIRVEGTYLDETEMFDLKRSLDTQTAIVAFLNRRADDEEEAPSTIDEEGGALPYKGRYPALHRLAQPIAVFPTLSQRIDAILDKFGRIKDTASPDLQRIRRELAATESSISRSLNAILRSAQQEGVVDKDVAPTFRDGRLVIPVAPALKRRIKGIIHDESATGKTVYIEPTVVVEANNRVRELEGEERREIIRILQTFTTQVRPHIPALLTAYEFMADIDFIRAKALLGHDMKAIPQQPESRPLIDWTLAVHPLLQRSLHKQQKKVVPLDIALDEHQRILIISGPNAGGKSVCLKTVGLLQYMLQCGLPIPIGEHSRTGIFESLFLDIGDEQSIEDDLSTYSGHLLNMKIMMRQCNDRSLLLIDEFGGGTEPQIGGAIAEAVLKRFHENGTRAVITTHYQNLKHFADAHEGVVNGAMLYDRQQMQALFQLEIGHPGSSFAVEIARKIGIPEDVIADAADLVGREYIHADKYLQDIVRDKRYWENKRRNIHTREKQLEQTLARYEAEIEDLHRSRKEIVAQAKEQAAELLSASNAQIEKTIKTIREAQAEREQTRAVRRELEAFREQLDRADEEQEREDAIVRKMKQLEERRRRKAERKEQKTANREAQQQAEDTARQEALRRTEEERRPIAAGDSVRIKGQSTVGIVEEVSGKTAFVTFGMMRTNVKTERLERATPQKTEARPQAATFVSRQTQDAVYERKLQFRQDIDVRGMRGDEALNAVTYFIDDAILLGVSRVRILHGTGTGILRTLIRQYLGTVSGVKDYRDEHVQFGGAGITVVDLA